MYNFIRNKVLYDFKNLKTVYLLFLILIICVQFSITKAQNYKLVWSDEFNSSSLDMSKWNYDIGTGTGGWGNNELQYYTDRDTNISIKNGNLIIRALKESYGGENYTSARIETQNKYSITYGKIEARIKLPYGRGMWPAFWMLGDDITTVSWPACGEIDIMEMVGGDGTNGSTNLSDATVYGTAHWSSSGSHAQHGGSYSLSGGKFADNYHTFTVTWIPQLITWYVDGHQYASLSITSSDLNAFQKSFYILLNLAVGGNWPGSPDSSTVFPQTMMVDYIRVYKDTSQQNAAVTISEPKDSSTFKENSNITITAEANAYAGTVTDFEFFQDDIPIGETNVSPYQMIWKNVSPGNYHIKAVATNSEGYKFKSNYYNVIVGNGAAEAPAAGTPVIIPGTIEAENFDLGGQNVAYYDTDTINNGVEYRLNDFVDIEACSDTGGGYDVGLIARNEWLKYTVDVKTAGTYQIECRVASAGNSGAFKVEIDGNDVTGIINVPNTGDWQNWATVVSKSFQLSGGIHTLKILMTGDNFNLNKIYVLPPNTQTSIKVLSPNGNEILQPGDIYYITWNSYRVGKVKISYYDGRLWRAVIDSFPANYGAYRWKVPNVTLPACKVLISDLYDNIINDVSDSSFSIGGINSVNDNQVLINYSLNQNYPNPFNPVTTISYSITQNSFVKLIVYNILGQPVKILVNRELTAGSYHKEFNAAGLSSGVYFYKLTAGNFSQMKKMIFLK
ncbi:MAG: family 16 glycosylhydrolase [Ignavibacteriaceae bacterium]